MTKEVKVKINGIQEGLEEESIKQEIIGKYYFRNNSHYIMFEKNDLINMLKASKDQVYIKNHKGKSNMTFVKGEEERITYYTPYGNMELDLFTKNIDLKLKEDMIAINLCYTLSSGNSFISEHEVHILIESII